MKKQSQFFLYAIENTEKPSARPRDLTASYTAEAAARCTSASRYKAYAVAPPRGSSSTKMKKQSQFFLYAIENTEKPTARPRKQPASYIAAAPAEFRTGRKASAMAAARRPGDRRCIPVPSATKQAFHCSLRQPLARLTTMAVHD
jgi:hypothetical protein